MGSATLACRTRTRVPCTRVRCTVRSAGCVSSPDGVRVAVSGKNAGAKVHDMSPGWRLLRSNPDNVEDWRANGGPGDREVPWLKEHVAPFWGGVPMLEGRALDMGEAAERTLGRVVVRSGATFWSPLRFVSGSGAARVPIRFSRPVSVPSRPLRSCRWDLWELGQFTTPGDIFNRAEPKQSPVHFELLSEACMIMRASIKLLSPPPSPSEVQAHEAKSRCRPDHQAPSRCTCGHRVRGQSHLHAQARERVHAAHRDLPSVQPRQGVRAADVARALHRGANSMHRRGRAAAAPTRLDLLGGRQPRR